MKKIYLPLAFASALLISLSACGSGTSHDKHEHAHEHAENEAHAHEHEDAHDHEAEVDGAHVHDEHAEGEAAHGDEIILTPEKAKAAGVVVKDIQPSTFRQVIRTSGEVLAAQGDEATVVATTAGIVSFPTPMVEGKSVGKGSNLMVVSARNLAEGEPAERARIAYEAAKDEYDRAQKLVDSGIVSKKEFATIKETYENARLGYEALVSQAGKTGQRILAPISGYVKTCLVKEGDYVTVGQPLMTLTQNRRLFLRAEVSERYYKYLSGVVSANFKTPYDDRVYALDELHGRVLSYGKSTDDSLFYLPITFEFDNRVDVVPGSYVEIYLLSGEMKDVMVLPKTAITEEQGVNFVYLQVDAEGYKKQEVKLGADNGREVQVLSGVHAGDKVVVEGAYHVKLASASNAIPAHTHEH
ncbi:MAG TPA: efflux transporter periplasmic adaptor subunit [Bacteroides sp.]|nr:efflux RND transporter periplasmic adaptor subunit [Phocaeicola coprophilus]HBB08322.1 efflux transporter periplasmic adaptor subunit [Bacteroides sp.]